MGRPAKSEAWEELQNKKLPRKLVDDSRSKGCPFPVIRRYPFHWANNKRFRKVSSPCHAVLRGLGGKCVRVSPCHWKENMLAGVNAACHGERDDWQCPRGLVLHCCI